MASATARKKSGYAQPRGTYGNLAYAQPAARPQERTGSQVLRPQPKVRPRERALTRPKVRVREAGQISVFAVVGFLAVGVFAILLMLSTIQLTMVSARWSPCVTSSPPWRARRPNSWPNMSWPLTPASSRTR